jgi:signal transduction histidine kinase/ActR/RegA family two-component response regulator
MTHPSVDPFQLTFLAGGGEMGERTRLLDWSTTPLGSPETWPQSLRSTVSMLLPSRAQIIMFWGRDFTVLYNDAYRPVLGAKHPNSLGRPGSHVWKEIWETQLRELLEGVVQTGEAFWARDLLFLIERHGFVEETYFDVSYDPVRVESGAVGGVFCIVAETTERVVGERRLKLLRDLAARNASARSQREACELAMHTLEATPDVAFALAYVGDELQAATPGAAKHLAESDPHLVKTLPLPASSGGKAGRMVVGLNPRRPFDDSHRNFLDLVADQFASALSHARAYETERQRVQLLEENAAVTETLNNVGALVASDLDRTKVVQAVTDAATEGTGAEFGAFFYNLVDERGEAYTLYTISGVPREAFSKFPMPRNTQVFEPTFKGKGVVRSDDITQEPEYGHNAPHHGMPAGHLPVRSYLAVPVKRRGGEVLGGLFLGHSEVGRFQRHHERLVVGIAAWAALALENAHLYTSVQQASRLKDEFLASLSHELRTPLNAILGYSRMLQSGLVASEKRQKAVDTIVRNAMSLTQIVEDVLDIARIVSGKIRLNVQPVDMPTIVRHALDGIAPTAEAKGVRIETTINPEAALISGDPERLQQILWNLLSNGVKFTKRGGKVEVRLERTPAHVELTVSDTGIGIAPEFLPHVFERFRQEEGGTTRERGGLGLGLSIAQQLTERHGGTIEATSGGQGQGATFRVKLPLMVAQPSPEPAPRAQPLAVAGPVDLGKASLDGLHVLAVDDEPDALALVGEVLEAVGARLSTAQSAEEALSKLAFEVPDVLVTDLGMPRMDGFELIQRLRRHDDPRLRALPAAALTAFARSEDRLKALQAGFQIHLTKPIDPGELVTTILALTKHTARATSTTTTD